MASLFERVFGESPPTADQRMKEWRVNQDDVSKVGLETSSIFGSTELAIKEYNSILNMDVPMRNRQDRVPMTYTIKDRDDDTSRRKPKTKDVTMFRLLDGRISTAFENLRSKLDVMKGVAEMDLDAVKRNVDAADLTWIENCVETIIAFGDPAGVEQFALWSVERIGKPSVDLTRAAAALAVKRARVHVSIALAAVIRSIPHTLVLRACRGAPRQLPEKFKARRTFTRRTHRSDFTSRIRHVCVSANKPGSFGSRRRPVSTTPSLMPS